MLLKRIGIYVISSFSPGVTEIFALLGGCTDYIGS